MTAALEMLHRELCKRGFSHFARREGSFEVVFSSHPLTQQQVHVCATSRGSNRLILKLTVQVRLVANSLLPLTDNCVDAVTVELGKNGIFPEEWNAAEHWRDTEVEQVVLALDRVALPWLAQYCDPRNLIAYLEKSLRDGVPVAPPIEPIVRKLVARWLLNMPSGPEVIRPPKYKELLANLYFGVGDMENSAHYMREWIDFWKGSDQVRPYIERLSQIERSDGRP